MNFFQGIEAATLRDGIFRFLDARQKAFKKIRKYPRFGSLKYRRKKSFYVREDNTSIRYEPVSNKVLRHLPYKVKPIGRARIPGMSRIQRSGVVISEVNVYDPEAPIKKARIVYDGKYWMLKYAIEVDITPEESYSKPVGVDLGISNYAVDSNGNFFKPITDNNKYQKLVRRKKNLQRKLARQRKTHVKGTQPSKRYFKTKNKLQAVERHLEEFKKSYGISMAQEILKDSPSVVVLENLNISGMLKNRRLSSHIHELGWYTFRQILEWEQTKKQGKVLIADTFFPSSKTCSNCNTKKERLSLSERVFTCDSCGFRQDRDLNAALNLKNLAYTAGSVDRLNSLGQETQFTGNSE